MLGKGSYELPFELLRVSLGLQERLSRVYSAEEWDACYVFAKKQAIVGVLFHGIEKVRNMGLQKRQFMRWVWKVDKLRERSKRLDDGCEWVTRWLADAGFGCVILKGQGLKFLYEPDLLRTPGDVDVWVMTEREKVCRFLKENVPEYDATEEGDLHTSFEKRGVTFEVHFTATYLIRPKYEKRLGLWLEKYKECREDIEGGEGLPVPTLEFNLVYLMLHMYRHYLFEGIGLRHVVDYVLLLRKVQEVSGSRFQDVLGETFETLKWLGAENFAGAMMWVIDYLLKLSEASEVLESSETLHLLCKGDPWRGRMLLKAILEGGNFGKSDKKNSDEYRQWGWKRIWRFASRNCLLVVAYPKDILWHLARRTGIISQ